MKFIDHIKNIINIKNIIGYLPVFCLFLVICGFSLVYLPNAKSYNKKLVDKKLPEMQFSSLNGFFSTKQLEGQRYVLHFFASWCGYCMEEHAELLKIYEKIPIYAIAWRDDPTDTKKLLKSYGNPYRDVGFDPYNSISDKMGIRVIPQTFVIDTSGEIIFYRRGSFDVRELLKFFPENA